MCQHLSKMHSRYKAYNDTADNIKSGIKKHIVHILKVNKVKHLAIIDISAVE